MELNLKGKTALVTGGSKGLGLAIKKALESEGVKVISWSKSEGVDLMKKIPPVPEVDFIIHNIGGFGSLHPVQHELIMKKNYGIMAEIVNIAPNSVTRMIAISSIYGKEAGHNEAFTASKAAVIAYMKSCSKKYFNSTFNTICPGHINVGKPFPDNPEIIGNSEDVADIVTFLCSDKAKHINGTTITVDGGASYSF